MWPFGRRVEELREEDLQELVGVIESVAIEFKAPEAYKLSEMEEKRKLLVDIVSFANAEGGAIIWGMDEDGEARATGLRPVTDAEKRCDQIQKLALQNISDRIEGLRAARVTIRSGEAVVVYIPRSYRRPHMVTMERTTQFYIRHDRQNAPMSMSEIRAALSSTAEMTMKVEQFIQKRRSVHSQYGPAILFMATPLLLEDGRVDIKDPRVTELLGRSPGGSTSIAPTLHGLKSDGVDRDGKIVREVEIFRNAHIEMFIRGAMRFGNRSRSGDWELNIEVLVKTIDEFVKFAGEVRAALDIADPFEVTLSVYSGAAIVLYGQDAKGQPREGRWRPDAASEGLDLHVPAVTFALDADPRVIGARIAERFANAFGFMHAPTP